ncbi:MAG: NAD-dependent deacylase [Gemmatimonadota bacterium]|nr:NAD-dependent deacylase [Gemmatimonadota bacterium]
MSNSTDHEPIDRAAGWIAGSSRLVVSTGAGVSRESGVPTFREAGGGFWEQYDPQQLATVEGFLAEPKLVWEWYAYRRKMVAEVKPNPGHYALARLGKILPGMALVTQNIDGLHQRAGSSRVIELHGNINRVKCFEGDEVIEDWSDEDYQGEVPPRCPRCNSLLRPDVVWFGESLPEDKIHQAFHNAQTCDVMLVVGTSGMVQPAASLPIYARRGGARTVEVNPNPTEISYAVDIQLRGKSGDILPVLVDKVEELIEEQAGGLKARGKVAKGQSGKGKGRL